MKILEKFLDDLANQDVKLWLEDERLRCNAPEGVLTSDIRTQLSNHKQEIINFFKQANLDTDYQQFEIKPFEPNGNLLPLSYAQQRLWLIEKIALSSNAYNMPLTLHLVGKLDFLALQKSLNQIITRHQTLRTTFSEINGTPVQVINPPFELVTNSTSQRTLSYLHRNTAKQAIPIARATHTICRLCSMAEELLTRSNPPNPTRLLEAKTQRPTPITTTHRPSPTCSRNLQRSKSTH